jgi:tRNA(Ile)-lysidine synthase
MPGPAAVFGPERLAALLDAIDPGWRGARLSLALSGGLDSTVLLHALSALAAQLPLQLRAMHVDHGLQPGAGDFVAACRADCLRAGVELEIIELGLEPPRGVSVEALARERRYAALAERLAGDERLVTAHHRDDQLETALIQLLRGAGVDGLAAMPARAALGRGWQLRPLLDVGRADLAEYAARQGLTWVEDPMNEAARFDRAYLRTRVLPAIRERWPAAAETVSRSSRHLAEAARLLARLAQDDAAGVVDDGRLSVAGLASLSRDRQVNLLRWWIRAAGLRPPPAARLEDALPAFLAARPDGAPMLRWDEGEVRRYRGRLYAFPPLPAPPAPEPGAKVLELGPGLGCFGLVTGTGGGISAGEGAMTSIRFRTGGESLRPHPGRPRKRLKDLCQEAGIVPWMRDRIPLVYVGERLAAVGDLWVEAEFAAPAGMPALMPVWSGRPRMF